MFLLKKTPEPALPRSNKEPAVENFKPSGGSHASVSEPYLPRGIFNQIFPIKYLPFNVPRLIFLKWLKQCNLYAACLASFQPEVAEVVDSGRSP
jgi:hypothetical protein